MKPYNRTESFRILNKVKKTKKKYTCEECEQTFEADPQWMWDENIICDDCYEEEMERTVNDEWYSILNESLEEKVKAGKLKKIVLPNGREHYTWIKDNETNRSETK